MNIKAIISQGKLKTYGVNSSFLQVYWSHPSLKENSFYLFVFTVLKNDLVSVNVVSPQYIPVRYKPKLYVAMIEKKS
ncbi:MAG TPA: hypothetical protein VKX35_01005 [Fermentimonas sp.]|nr:hypothetical protein [Fermentimonas sp.]